jgi:hypothetical protein
MKRPLNQSNQRVTSASINLVKPKSLMSQPTLNGPPWGRIDVSSQSSSLVRVRVTISANPHAVFVKTAHRPIGSLGDGYQWSTTLCRIDVSSQSCQSFTIASIPLFNNFNEKASLAAKLAPGDKVTLASISKPWRHYSSTETLFHSPPGSHINSTAFV